MERGSVINAAQWGNGAWQIQPDAELVPVPRGAMPGPDTDEADAERTRSAKGVQKMRK